MTEMWDQANEIRREKRKRTKGHKDEGLRADKVTQDA